MTWLILLAVVFVIFMFPTVRIVLLHPIKTVYYAIKDVFLFFKYKKWRICDTGKIICYCALFGKGKTLSVVHYVCSLYEKYNNKRVYDSFRKKWVTQKIHILSNVELNGIPYDKFVSLSQIVDIADRTAAEDEENNTLTCHIVLGDEFSVQMNSRKFKENIDALFLNALLTCRHHHISIVYDAQRFNHVDALLRQVTSYVVQCNKRWRILRTDYYDAFELENANNPRNVRPIRRTGWFVANKDFARYDTLACVKNLQKSSNSGDMMTEAEILTLQGNNAADMASVSRPTRSYQRNMRRAYTRK